MILKLHASSPLWCLLFWFLGTTYFRCSFSSWFHGPQASCLFTLVMFVSWFLGTTYFRCSFSSWFHGPQASCLFTLVMFVSWFLGTTYFRCFFSSWFHGPQASCLFTLVMYMFIFWFRSTTLFSFLLVSWSSLSPSLLASMLGSLTPPKLGHHHLLPCFLQLLKSFDLSPPTPLVFASLHKSLTSSPHVHNSWVRN